MKILVVDDDAEIRDVIGYALQRAGFAVAFAEDGWEALSAWEREAPDVVLLDLRMPGPDGLAVLRAIRQTSEAPVIMVSAWQAAAALQAFQLGADDYIAKPFSRRVPVARVVSV